jgi:hypothetical protein
VKPFRHNCPDWDFMQIGLSDIEAVGCSCYRGIPDADELYELRSKELDELNKRKEETC